MSKTILFLGAAHFQVPAIQYAKQRGYKVITADNRPHNPGHKLADRSHNISTLDQASILALAKREAIDGIITFASDVSAPTVAYVAAKLNLPGQNYDVICNLVNKAKFRETLNAAGLQTLEYNVFAQDQINLAIQYLQSCRLPMIVKPTEGSGSRGATIVRDHSQIQQAITLAFSEAHSKTIIIETFKQRQGKQLCGDGFMQQGKLVFFEFGDGHVPNSHSLVPCAETFPTTHPSEILIKIKQKVENVLQHIGFHTGVFNLDCFLTTDDEPFIVEIGPRSGGNFIPRAIQLRTGIDLVAAAVEACCDPHYQLPLTPTTPKHDFIACYMLYSMQSGIFKHIQYHPDITTKIIEDNPYLQPGETIHPFTKGSAAIGNIILQFDTFAQMQTIIANMHNYYQIKTEAMETHYDPIN